MNNGPVDPMEIIIQRAHYGKVENAAKLVELYEAEKRRRE